MEYAWFVSFYYFDRDIQGAGNLLVYSRSIKTITCKDDFTELAALISHELGFNPATKLSILNYKREPDADRGIVENNEVLEKGLRRLK